MKILPDINARAQLAWWLRFNDIHRADVLGWHELTNGCIARCGAEREGFDVLVTCDQNIPYQDLTWRRLASVIPNDWRRENDGPSGPSLGVDRVRPRLRS